jgi:hypothetical protein
MYNTINREKQNYADSDTDPFCSNKNLLQSGSDRDITRMLSKIGDIQMNNLE